MAGVAPKSVAAAVTGAFDSPAARRAPDNGTAAAASPLRTVPVANGGTHSVAAATGSSKAAVGGPVATGVPAGMPPAPAGSALTPAGGTATAGTGTGGPLGQVGAGGVSGGPVAASAPSISDPPAQQQPATPVTQVAPGAMGTASAQLSPPAAVPSTAPAPTPQQPLAAQLSSPIFTLSTAAATRGGEQTLTVQVTPADLGPVTVRAHLTAQGVHIELFSAGDAGRDALRQALPDLRRDLAAAGGGGSIDVSSQATPDDGGSAQGYESPRFTRFERDLPAPTQQQRAPRVPSPSSDHAIDVMA
jgi:hypothetical protein